MDGVLIGSLTDEELIQHVGARPESTEMEKELAVRLGAALDTLDEIQEMAEELQALAGGGAGP